ncbi:MAG: PP2C family protein-serine/threonine phosphatase [Flavobacteriales bacterium]|nr:serine/threonine-protein phosphatase [Flavobacteriales bacterium]
MGTPDLRTTRKVVSTIYGTLLLLCIGVIAIVHIAGRKAEMEKGTTRLNGITAGLAAQLNADHVQLVLDRYDGRGMLIKNTQDAWYYVLSDQLRKAAEHNGISGPIRVLTYDSLKQELQIAVSSTQVPEFRMPCTDAAPVITRTYGHTGHAEVRIGEEETLLSHAALRNASGALVGTVVATMPVNEVLGGATSAMWRNIGVALLLFAIVGAGLITAIRRWLERAERASRDLQQRHAGIADSIAYAGKIQRALVPSPEVYNELFESSFVIDRPKDMVSGDFHWYQRIDEDTCFVAAADCTGHGLPGAMLAAIGCSLLNEIVPRQSNSDPAELLGQLNTRLITTLHQQGVARGAGDGMDVALCRIDRKAREILFAGAFRPLFWLHEGQLTVINGDRKPIGGSQHELDRRFTVHRLAYSPGDRIYLFSDGYVDQFGGPERKRFMSARLQDLLGGSRALTMGEQAELLERAFTEWKGSEEQVDDVCVLGLAV